MNNKETKADLNPEELEGVSGAAVDFAGNQLNSKIAAGERIISITDDANKMIQRFCNDDGNQNVYLPTFWPRYQIR